MMNIFVIGAALIASAEAGVIWTRPQSRGGGSNVRLIYDGSGLTNGQCGQGQESTTRSPQVVLWTVKDGKKVPGGLQLGWTYQHQLKQNFTVDMLSFTKKKGEDPTLAPTAAPLNPAPTLGPKKKPRETKKRVYFRKAPDGTTGETDTIYKNITSGIPTCRPGSRKVEKTCVLRMMMIAQPETGDSSRIVSCSNVFVLSSDDDTYVNVQIRMGKRDTLPMLPSSFKTRFLNSKYNKQGYTADNVWVVPTTRAEGDHYKAKDDQFKASGGTYTVRMVLGDQYGARGDRNIRIGNNSEELGSYLAADTVGFRDAMGLTQEDGPRLVSITYGGKAALAGAASTTANLAALATLMAAAFLLRKD
jgi:hypothetical protein